jgi:hypothetical protein
VCVHACVCVFAWVRDVCVRARGWVGVTVCLLFAMGVNECLDFGFRTGGFTNAAGLFHTERLLSLGSPPPRTPCCVFAQPHALCVHRPVGIAPTGRPSERVAVRRRAAHDGNAMRARAASRRELTLSGARRGQQHPAAPLRSSGRLAPATRAQVRGAARAIRHA